MTNQEILEKAIQKAIDGGWKFAGNNNEATIEVKYRDGYFGNDPYFLVDWHMPTDNSERSVFDVIFNHDFAKALWGEGDSENHTMTEDSLLVIYHSHTGWQYHLQMMVIAPDPIKYLGEHL